MGFAPDFDAQAGAQFGKVCWDGGQGDWLFQRWRPGPAGNDANGFAVVENLIVVTRDGTSLQFEADEPFVWSRFCRLFQCLTANEVGRHFEMHEPAQACFEGVGVGIHVLAIKVHGGLEAQGVTGAETTGCDAFLEELGPESLTVFCREQQFNAILTGVASAGGEDGAELLLTAEDGQRLWSQLLEKGVAPCGLGARDTLRLEAAMHLYGQDMNADTTPFEAGLGWLVHLEMPADFIGRQALEKAAEAGPNKRLVGLKLEGRAIARHDYPVLHNGEPVGVVTSGTWSPTLEEPIALASIPTALAKLGTNLSVEIRGKAQPATVVRRPFYKRP